MTVPPGYDPRRDGPLPPNKQPSNYDSLKSPQGQMLGPPFGFDGLQS